jgi:hypothetical protein
MNVEELTNEELLDSYANAAYWECEGWGKRAEEAERLLPLLRAEILRRMK